MKKTNLIALQGKMGSGKDLAAKIIQYLQYNLDQGTNISFDEYEIKSLGYTNKWQIKKFAGKLKEILSLLTGIPIKDLEKEEVKNSYLGEEWNRWVLEFQEDIYTDFQIWDKVFSSKEDVEKSTEYAFSNTEDSIGRSIKERLTVRKTMQLVGQLFRQYLNTNTWINALFADYKEIGTKNKLNYSTGNFYDSKEPIYPNWIISDLRFPNEAQAILDRNGIIIKIERPIHLRFPKLWEEFSSKHKLEDWEQFLKDKDLYDVIYNESETALDDFKDFTYIIENNSTIYVLIDKVKEILIKENIL